MPAHLNPVSHDGIRCMSDKLNPAPPTATSTSALDYIHNNIRTSTRAPPTSKRTGAMKFFRGFSVALATAVLAATDSAMGQPSTYTHDGTTTYCWRTPASYEGVVVPSNEGAVKGEGAGCPVSLSVQLLNVTSIRSGMSLPVKWTVKLEPDRLATNTIGLDKFYPAIENATGNAIDIIHSRLYTCDFGSNCDLFQPGSGQVNSTSDQRANVSSAGTITFTSDNELAFIGTGEFSVMAHVVMGSSSNPGRTDYIVYTKVTLQPKSASSTQPMGVDDSNSDGLSPTAIAIIVVGAVAVVALVAVLVWFLRAEKKMLAMQETGPVSFFSRASTQRDLEKTYAYFHNPAGQINGRDQPGPKMSAPKSAPYTQFPSHTSYSSSTQDSNASSHRLNRQSGEVPMFNRAGSSQYAESTYSYLHENAAHRGAEVQRLHRIYGTQNSTDGYSVADRSIDGADPSYAPDRFDFENLTDSTRSNATESYSAFVVESNRTSMMISGRSTLMESGATSMLESGVLDSNASMMISGRSTLMDSSATSMLESGVLDSDASMMISGRSSLMESGATSMLESGNTSMLESAASILLVSGQTTMFGSGRVSMLDSRTSIVDSECMSSLLDSGSSVDFSASSSSVVNVNVHERYDSDLGGDFEFDGGIETRELSTKQLRQLKIEL